MFGDSPQLPEPDVRAMSPRVLAHLGDAVFHLFEREREILTWHTPSHIHRTATKRSSAAGQADLLDVITTRLTDTEADLVRRARNMKPGQRRTDQAAYRLATAFEALLGYLYLTNPARLREVLGWTIEGTAEAPNGEPPPNVKDRL